MGVGDGDVNDDDGDDAVVEAVVVVGRAKVRYQVGRLVGWSLRRHTSSRGSWASTAEERADQARQEEGRSERRRGAERSGGRRAPLGGGAR